MTAYDQSDKKHTMNVQLPAPSTPTFITVNQSSTGQPHSRTRAHSSADPQSPRAGDDDDHHTVTYHIFEQSTNRITTSHDAQADIDTVWEDLVQQGALLGDH